VAADVEEGAVVAEAVLEAGKIVADIVEGAEPLDEAGGDLLAEGRWGSRPELHFGRCRALPHGGRQLSWYFGDSSHGGGLMEGIDGVQRWVCLEIVLLGHDPLPRFRALHSGGNTPTSCLVFILNTRWLTRLLELYCLEVEEEEFHLSSLKVQASLYRRGPGYRFGVRLPACRLLHGCGLDMGPTVLWPSVWAQATL
jgi:hypothetical protein